MTEFTKVFPSEEIRIIISAIRNQDVPLDILGRAIWSAQGYAMYAALGPGVTLKAGQSDTFVPLGLTSDTMDVLSEEKLATALESVIAPEMALQFIGPASWILIGIALANLAVNVFRRQQQTKRTLNPMATNATFDAEAVKNLKGFDAETIKKLFELAGQFGPVLYQLCQQLLNLLIAKEQAKLGKPDDHCPHCDETCCECIAAAKKSLLEALSHIVHLEHSCKKV